MVEADYADPDLLHHAESIVDRVIDRQLEAHRSIADRAQGVMRLGIAQIGGITAITGYLLTRNLLQATSGVLILVSVIIGTLGTFFALRSAVGSFTRRTLVVGPAIESILTMVDEGDTLAEAQNSLLVIGKETVAENNETIRRASRLLVASNYTVGGSTLVFLTALVYIIGKAIA